MTRFQVAAAPTPTQAKALAAHDTRIQQLLVNRNIDTAAAAEAWLAPAYEAELHDPYLLHDMDKAVTRIQQAIAKEEQIVIFSDYDCDGIPGAVVLHDFFAAIPYAHFSNYIPHRHYEGFGLSVTAVEKLAAAGAQLLITIDCGTADMVAVARAGELGLDVIITDHHQAKDTLPAAIAVVNPAIGDTYPFPHLCGAGVVFKLVQALLATGEYSIPAGREKWWLDMVGVATIADMVPLTGENRTFAHYGLQVLRKSRRPGLQKLLRKQQASQQHLTADDIGFTIGPRINAASRMGAPMEAFALLVATDDATADTQVAILEQLNNDRKGAVAAMTRAVHGKLKNLTEIPPVLVLGDPDWKPSLVGLVANKLAEEYNVPAFVWGRDGNGVLKGSCRSDGQLSLITLMEAAAESFASFGGHHFSGGFSVTDDAIHTLPSALLAAHAQLGESANVLEPTIIDAVITLEDITTTFVRTMTAIGPFGTGNPKPLFQCLNIVPTQVVVFGKTKEHTKLVFETKGVAKEAIAFFALPETFSKTPVADEPLTLIGHVEQSFFMGRLQTRLRIVDIT